MNRFHSNAAFPYVCMLLGMLSLGMGTSYAKTLFPLIGAQGTSAYRVGISALLLLAIWRPWRFGFQRNDLKNIALYGGALGCMNLMFYMSLKTIPLGIAIAVEFSGPLILALFYSRRWTHFLWVGLAMVGLALLLPFGAQNDVLDPVGLAYAAGAGVFWALYIVFGKRLSHVHSGHAVAMGMTIAAVVIVPFGVAEAGISLLHPAILLSGLAVAIFSSALPYTLEMQALPKIPERTFGVILSAEPAVGALAALFLIGEHLDGRQWIAIMAMIVAAAGAIATSGKPAHEQEGAALQAS